MKDVYLDKKDRMKERLTPARIAVASAVALVLFLAPFWPDSVEGRFVLEPARRAVIRAEVPGVVSRVMVTEDQPVAPGTALVRLHNLPLESAAAAAEADYREASARATNAGLHYSDFGGAERERQERAERDRLLAEQLAHLQVTSPIAGVVVSPRLQDLVGSYVAAGTRIAEIADLGTMIARIYIPEFGVRDVRIGTRVRLLVRSRPMPISGKLASIAVLSSEIDGGLREKEQLSGIVQPPFYVGSVMLPGDANLREGMTGTAKIFVRRRSPAEMLWRFGSSLVQRRLW
jgi:multidrug resistance efflux pump